MKFFLQAGVCLSINLSGSQLLSNLVLLKFAYTFDRFIEFQIVIGDSLQLGSNQTECSSTPVSQSLFYSKLNRYVNTIASTCAVGGRLPFFFALMLFRNKIAQFSFSQRRSSYNGSINMMIMSQIEERKFDFTSTSNHSASLSPLTSG